MERHMLSQDVFRPSDKMLCMSMSPMDSLLTAVDCIQKSSHAPPHAMSIETLLDTHQHTTTADDSLKRRHPGTDEQRHLKMRRHSTEKPPQVTTVTCFHAAVAQKSYGTEKRFLCPPPMVSMRGQSTTEPAPLVSLAVVCDNGERPLEQSMVLDDHGSGSFKYLHVKSAAKAKQFFLRVSLRHRSHECQTPRVSTQAPYATFFSAPLTIISKPSKKTSKAHHLSSCIVANAPVSLFNRINSQTVRTKYMTVADGQLSTKHSTWSPFDIVVVRQPPPPTDKPMPSHVSGDVPVTYGSEIVLRDRQTGVSSPPLIICKVDKGLISTSARGPVSQMQKIALCLASTFESDLPSYLCAEGKPVDPAEEGDVSNATHYLCFQPSTWVTQPNQEKAERIDDSLCWTIVGIARFEYTFTGPTPPGACIPRNVPLAPQQQPSPPPSPPRRIVPHPVLSAVTYHPNTHTLDITGQHLTQPTTPPRLFEFYLGQHGPLTRQQQQNQKDDVIHLSLQLPPSRDLVLANHNQLVTRSDNHRSLELPLLIVHHDGSMFPSGMALACDVLLHCDAARWYVTSASTSS